MTKYPVYLKIGLLAFQQHLFAIKYGAGLYGSVVS
jgi:hypothetical protein